jgi:hydroxymethylglutaryl-CoA lyase
MPDQVASQLRAIRERWPQIHTFHLHLHDARGTALLSAYEALKVLGPEQTLILDSSIGGMGGCPYGGHGRMTRMIPTEDLVNFLHELGIPTGVDLARLIDAAILAEDVVGHSLWGHVSKAGPRPRGDQLFPMDLPFIETEKEAQHFRLGPRAYAGARSPWSAPIVSPARDALVAESSHVAEDS